MDLDQVITREGEQLQTVGHHWPLDGPLTQEMREHMERVGVCLSCHKEIPNGRFVYQVVSRIGEFLGLIPKTDPEHHALISRAMFIAANVEIFGAMTAGIAAFVLVAFFLRRRRRRRA